MGVQARLVVYAPDEETAANACRLAYRRIAEIDRIASDYILDSELNRLCAKSGGPPVVVSRELFYLLQTACELAHNSNGAFDPTVGPLIRLWRTARKSTPPQLPPADQLSAARHLVGYQKIKLDPANRSIQLALPGMKLDLGGIAKGYAAHQAVLTLSAQGLPIAFCEFGGDVYVGEAPPEKPGWIMDVTNDLPRGRSRKIFVKNTAVATSGDFEQFVIIDGNRYSHILDPRTGLGLTHSNLITILHPEGILADGLSTALSVLPPDQARALAKSYNAKTYIRPSQY
jgi:thiamine biosynthesis lipoprotein